MSSDIVQTCALCCASLFPQVRKWEGAPSGPEFSQAVEEMHGRYVAALRALWDTHKVCAALVMIGIQATVW